MDPKIQHFQQKKNVGYVIQVLVVYQAGLCSTHESTAT